jgi:hypothetical protein
MRRWYLLPLVVALCPMCADSEGDEWSGVYDDYDCNSEPEGCECPPEVGNPCPTGSLPPDATPCEVGEYCWNDSERCSLLFRDPDNPACQLTQELQCVINRWRANLGPTEIYDNDPDCTQDAATREDADAAFDARAPLSDASDASSHLDAAFPHDSATDADLTADAD